MSCRRCTKEWYKAFLQASNMRYSGLALSEVSPELISHDSVSRWLNSQCFRPREIWQIADNPINFSEPSLLIADDTVLAKPRNKKIELVNDPYSGHAHDLMAGIGLINWLWYGLDVAVYHREIKQNRGIERCQARTPVERSEILSFWLSLIGFNSINDD